MSEISKTADKALVVLTCLSVEGRASLQQLSERTQLNRTVTQRLLVTLTQRGFIVRSGNDYAVSSRLHRMAQAVFTDLRSAAHDPLARLSRKAGATAALQVFDAGESIVLDERLHPGSPELRARLEVGARTPLTGSAAGIAILAALNPRERSRVLKRVTPTDPSHKQILNEISTTQSTGIAMLERETHRGVNEIAAPVKTLRSSAASISLLTPLSVTRELGATSLRARQEIVREAANDIEATLGTLTTEPRH